MFSSPAIQSWTCADMAVADAAVTAGTLPRLLGRTAAGGLVGACRCVPHPENHSGSTRPSSSRPRLPRDDQWIRPCWEMADSRPCMAAERSPAWTSRWRPPSNECSRDRAWKRDRKHVRNYAEAVHEPVERVPGTQPVVGCCNCPTTGSTILNNN